MGGGDCIERNFGHKPAKPLVADAAGGFFNGFGGLAGCGICFGFGCDIDAGLVERQAEAGGEVAREFQIGVGFFAAQAVMEMGGVEHQAEFGAAFGQRAQQGYGVCAAGEAYGQTQAGLEQRGVDSEGAAHDRMIICPMRGTRAVAALFERKRSINTLAVT